METRSTSRSRGSLVTCAFVLLLGTAGCSGSSGNDGLGSSSGGASGGAGLTDDQIVGIVNTANSGEIAQARLAESITQNADVQNIAMMMATMHGQLNAQLTSVSQKDDLPPATSAIEQMLASGGQQTMAMLQGLTGSSFDLAYVDANVQAHQGAMQLFQTQLIPDATNPDLKAFLQNMLPVVQAHLQAWTALQAKLGDGGSP